MAKHHHSPGVFDVSKPHKTGPSATSRPVIVGHHPQVSDPMVKEKDEPEPETKSIPVAVHDHEDTWPQDDQQETKDISHSMIVEPPKMSGGMPDIGVKDDQPNEEEHEKDLMAHAQVKKDIVPIDPNVHPDEEPRKIEQKPEFTPVDITLDSKQPAVVTAGQGPRAGNDAMPTLMTEPLHISKGKGSSGAATKMVKWTLISVLTIAVTAFLAIDSGLVASNIGLPFHILNNQKRPTPVIVTTPSPAPVITPPPAPNLIKFSVPGATLSFSYPTSWGNAATSTEQGYASRGAGAKPTADYAYLVNFEANKDVQLAITSSKFLPPARGAQYYDFLGWCVGTSDQKIYKSLLHFSTTSGVDSPTTITCDQGPLNDASKLNADTIVQLKTTTPDGKTVLGDIYTKNIAGTNLSYPVLRVKDSAMTNGEAVKKLLISVKSTSAAQ